MLTWSEILHQYLSAFKHKKPKQLTLGNSLIWNQMDSNYSGGMMEGQADCNKNDNLN